jgi:hypothetical protein
MTLAEFEQQVFAVCYFCNVSDEKQILREERRFFLVSGEKRLSLPVPIGQ